MRKQLIPRQDQDRGGNISIEEFGRVMKETGQNPTDEELAQIIKEVDLDGDGTINFDGIFITMPENNLQILATYTCT